MKARLNYVPAALADLEEIRLYISEELQNPTAGTNAVLKILKRITVLEEYPNSGPLLTDGFGRKTIYRYLVCGSYIAIYKHHTSSVTIVRVLYHKRDFTRIKFDE